MSGDGKNSEVSLERVLCLLDRWRHLPAYQLERRVDILFALFLPEVLENFFCINKLHLIPEFPIKKSLLPRYYNDTTSQSINVDFLAVEEVKDSRAARRAFLVELKTDMASIRDVQLCDLRSAAEKGMEELIKGVIEICKSSTKQRKKYVHLLKLLSCLDLTGYEDDLFPPRPGFRKKLGCIEGRMDSWPCLEVVYVAPKAVKNMVTVNFNCFADVIEKSGSDRIAACFAGYLKKWACEVAGETVPKDWISH